MKTDDAPINPDEYAEWVKMRIAAQLRLEREAEGLSPYALTEPGMVTDETVRNIENGKHCPKINTLALICLRLGTQVEAFVPRALRKG